MVRPSTSTCAIALWPTVTRYTLLDSCNRVLCGPASQFVKRQSSLQVTTNITENDDLTLPGSDGRPCAVVPRQNTINNITLTFAYCGFDTEFMSTANDSYEEIFNYSGDVIGLSRGYSLQTNTRMFIETWFEVNAEVVAACELDAENVGDAQWLWMGWGPVSNWSPSQDVTYDGQNLQPVTWTGTTLNERLRWGRGPYNVLLDQNGQPAPWANAIRQDHLDSWAIVNVAPPEDMCGSGPVSCPDAPMFTLTCNEADGSITLTLTGNTEPDANYVVDWGDGTGTQIITDGTATHTYPENYTNQYDEALIGVWEQGNTRNYRGTFATLPCSSPTIEVSPTSGDAPLQVVATVDNCPGDSTPEVTYTPN